MKLYSDSCRLITNSKRHRLDCSLLPCKKPRSNVLNTAYLQIKPLGIPLIRKSTGSSCDTIHLQPYKPYSIGRNCSRCDFIFEDCRVSNIHLQILFNPLNNKLYLSDGLFFSSSNSRVSLNGVFVNGVRVAKGEVVDICVGDEVSLGCGSQRTCCMGLRLGFCLQKAVFVQEVFDRNIVGDNDVTPTDCVPIGYASYKRIAKANVLLHMCREVLSSNHPVSCIQKRVILDYGKGVRCHGKIGVNEDFKFPVASVLGVHSGEKACRKEVSIVEDAPGQNRECDFPNDAALAIEVETCNLDGKGAEQVNNDGASHENGSDANGREEVLSLGCMRKEVVGQIDDAMKEKNRIGIVPPPGKKFVLNRLACEGPKFSEDPNVVSLPELLYPIENLEQLFIATFTADIPWFLSYCEIPTDLPVTIACHNAERCWSSSSDKRTSKPYPDFPNLVVVYPPFPEVIAFGQDLRKSGIGCHHPKLLVLQRRDSLRVVVTSANLVAGQWCRVTNTIWWQDFPRLDVPDYFSLFTAISGEENGHLVSDFAAQLAGFMASLVADVPSQAHWILELTNYDFKESDGYLVASVPGIHSSRIPFISKPKHFLGGDCVPELCHFKSVGSVEASVAGLSHLFRTSVDLNGARLKKLASYLRKCGENVYGISEVILKRDPNIQADANAVSILVPNPDNLSLEECVQLGFLPKNFAKWVAPLSDSGLFVFSAYIFPSEVLSAALEGSSSKVQLVLHVSQGPSFSAISEIIRGEHVSAICTLIASLQRCWGIWRLQEVLGQFKWPEHLETDFVFGASSIGSINAKFLAAFSAAGGKRSLRLSESEESDPDWGCWSVSQELRNPSIRIIFPTIERVKNASSGILASRRILCFSQKTWYRLKTMGILHDAVPFPGYRIGYPMHVKVARRRFQSKKDASPFGWVYCGSHNFSEAAWGRPVSGLHDKKINGNTTYSSLGSRLHVSNYELGILFITPPPDAQCKTDQKTNLDDIVLPFIVPAPKYRPADKPATAQEMREALFEQTERGREVNEETKEADEWIQEEIPVEEEEVIEAIDYVVKEREDDKAYAEKLWNQVDSSENC
ncbi:PREDICTED: uncharacterized protein LOC109214181 [Nicotiana attenuata]|uniref:FHA domain-containing protein n=1 Tax=Nicotiana attenuata TaxID=49451 RepID=A0A1J6KB23_NICAT|nr:PREDICTED: uncharacterized protein LOC109214181 [Nicotiana attenuata]OIT27261.1 hypothetical protein A4A49_26320 [Nicotiana attenuata]